MGRSKRPLSFGRSAGARLTVMRLGGKFELAVLQSGAHAVLAFFHFGFRQSDDGELGQAVGEVHLDGDQRGIHARQTAAV